MKYLMMGFNNFANFTGRSTRKEYWMFILTTFLITLGLGFVGALVGLELLSSIFSLVALIPSISFAARRLHDTGKSGWWQLLYFIPIIGFIVVIVLLIFESDEDNKYGKKGVDDVEKTEEIKQKELDI
jgi:uncharacterized membrane protein YhaH (DUF805 family)